MQTDTDKIAETEVNKIEIVGKALDATLNRMDDRSTDKGGPPLPYLMKMTLQLIAISQGERIYDDIVRNFQS